MSHVLAAKLHTCAILKFNGKTTRHTLHLQISLMVMP